MDRPELTKPTHAETRWAGLSLEPGRVIKAVMATWFLGLGLFLVSPIPVGTWTVTGVVFVTLLVMAGIGLARYAWRSVRIDDGTVTIRNMRRTYRVPVEQADRFHAGIVGSAWKDRSPLAGPHWSTASWLTLTDGREIPCEALVPWWPDHAPVDEAVRRLNHTLRRARQATPKNGAS